MFSDIFGTFTLHLVDIGFPLLLLVKNPLFLKKYIWQKDYFTQFFVAMWPFIGIKDFLCRIAAGSRNTAQWDPIQKLFEISEPGPG